MKNPEAAIGYHPGVTLSNFILHYGMTQKQLAKEILSTTVAINEIIRGKRGISVDMAIRLSLYFRTSIEFWCNLQMQYDILNITSNEELMESLNKRIIKINKENLKVLQINK